MSHCIPCNFVMRKALRPVSHQTRPKTPQLMKASAVNPSNAVNNQSRRDRHVVTPEVVYLGYVLGERQVRLL
jgi:hypothetical protein